MYIMLAAAVVVLTGAAFIHFGSFNTAPMRSAPTSTDSAPESSALNSIMNDDKLFTLQFYVGSLSGMSVEVHVDDTDFTYRKVASGGHGEVEHVERTLSTAELDSLQQTVSEMGLLSTPSQDFSQQPLTAEQPSYDVSVSLFGNTHTVKCGVPISIPVNECQAQLNELQTTLRTLLDTNVQ